jgi:hypothetical protein
MSSGGDSVGMGTSCGANDVIGSHEMLPVTNGKEMDSGAGTVTVAAGGAHVEQHIEGCEHSPPSPCPQPSWSPPQSPSWSPAIAQ